MTDQTPSRTTRFTFRPRWKEELVCTSDGGSFIIDMPWGIVTVYAPTRAAWEEQAQPWDINHYDTFIDELERWWRQINFPLAIVDDAWMTPE